MTHLAGSVLGRAMMQGMMGCLTTAGVSGGWITEGRLWEQELMRGRHVDGMCD